MRNDVITNKRESQSKFIRELCDNIRDDVLSQVDRMPFEWDGHELRMYLAERFNRCTAISHIKKEPRGRRAKQYKCTVCLLPEGKPH